MKIKVWEPMLAKWDQKLKSIESIMFFWVGNVILKISKFHRDSASQRWNFQSTYLNWSAYISALFSSSFLMTQDDCLKFSYNIFHTERKNHLMFQDLPYSCFIFKVFRMIDCLQWCKLRFDGLTVGLGPYLKDKNSLKLNWPHKCRQISISAGSLFFGRQVVSKNVT